MFLRSNSGVCRTYKNGEIILELFITKFHSFVSIVVNLFLLETNFPEKKQKTFWKILEMIHLKDVRAHTTVHNN